MKKLIAASMVVMIAGALSVFAVDAKTNWTKHCAKCHGEDGKGKTKMGEKLGAKDYTDPAVQAKWKDDELAKAIKEGVKDKSGKVAMKGFADTLSDEEIKELVKHTRAFKK